MGDLLGVASNVAGVRVLCDEAERLLLPAAADRRLSMSCVVAYLRASMSCLVERSRAAGNSSAINRGFKSHLLRFVVGAWRGEQGPNLPFLGPWRAFSSSLRRLPVPYGASPSDPPAVSVVGVRFGGLGPFQSSCHCR